MSSHGSFPSFSQGMRTQRKCTVNRVTPMPKPKKLLTIGFDSLDFSRKRLPKNSWTGFNRSKSRWILFKEWNRESLRNIMLKQEETFKEQVCELHRLYRVQKMLMAEVNKELKILSPTSATPAANTETKMGQQTRLKFEHRFHHWDTTRAGLSALGSSIFSGEISTMHRGFDLENPVKEDIASDVGAIEQAPVCQKLLGDNLCSDSAQLCTSGVSDVELTLTIGCSVNGHILRHQSHMNIELGCSKTTSNETQQILSTPVKSGEEEQGNSSASSSRESLLRTSWPFQTLSLNRT